MFGHKGLSSVRSGRTLAIYPCKRCSRIMEYEEIMLEGATRLIIPKDAIGAEDLIKHFSRKQ